MRVEDVQKPVPTLLVREVVKYTTVSTDPRDMDANFTFIVRHPGALSYKGGTFYTL